MPVRTVAGGGALIDPSVARKVVAEFARLTPPARPMNDGLPDPLTERELDVLRCLAQGFSQPRDRKQTRPHRRYCEKLCH